MYSGPPLIALDRFGPDSHKRRQVALLPKPEREARDPSRDPADSEMAHPSFVQAPSLFHPPTHIPPPQDNRHVFQTGPSLLADSVCPAIPPRQIPAALPNLFPPSSFQNAPACAPTTTTELCSRTPMILPCVPAGPRRSHRGLSRPLGHCQRSVAIHALGHYRPIPSFHQRVA